VSDAYNEPEPKLLDEEPEPLDLEDADAFFAAEVSTVRPAVLRLYGEEYELPTRTPLAFVMLAERNAADSSIDAVRKVLTPVFGEDALDVWVDRGMDDRQFGVILLWSTQNMRQPGCMTLAEAARIYDEQAAAGKAPAPTSNRAARRAAQRGGSGRRS
jgi:hypothetical protein